MEDAQISVRPLPLGPFTGFCRCGVQVWESPTRSGIPRYSETIICASCGADNSRRDFPGYHHYALMAKIRLARRWWQVYRHQFWHVNIPNFWYYFDRRNHVSKN